MKITHAQDYAEQRAKSYPSVNDQLDAIWAILLDPKNKLDLTLGAVVADKIKAVKTKYPKP
jgi:hypothetical protein